MSGENYDKWTELVDRTIREEPLTEEEQRFVERVAGADPMARAEMDCIAQLERFEGPVDELAGQRIVAGVLKAVNQPSRRRGNGTSWAIGGLAVAAAAALWFRTQPAEPEGSAAMLRATGSVSVNGRAVQRGDRVPEGSEVRVDSGVACIEVASDIVSCFGEGTRLSLTRLERPERRLDLHAGTVVSGLAKQPPGHRFSVVVGGAWSTAIGTAFSVERLSSTESRTAVYEGVVQVSQSGAATAVPSHKMVLSKETELELQPVDRAPDSPAWRALQEVTGVRLEGPAPLAASTAEESAQAARAQRDTDMALADGPDDSVVASTKPRAQRASPVPHEESAVEPKETAASLLAAARSLRQQQRWAEATEKYRYIQREFSDSPEAHAVRVSLGDLQLSRLGQPDRALQSFDAYLVRGGPLAVEARLGRIRALRALGATQREAESIREFLRMHPRSLEVSPLTERLDSLTRD